MGRKRGSGYLQNAMTNYLTDKLFMKFSDSLQINLLKNMLLVCTYSSRIQLIFFQQVLNPTDSTIIYIFLSFRFSSDLYYFFQNT